MEFDTTSPRIITNPDSILMGLFNEKVGDTLKPVLANILKEHLPLIIRKSFVNQEVDSILKSIGSCKTIDGVMELINKAPVYLRLKSTARALFLLAKKENKEIKDIDMTIAWF